MCAPGPVPGWFSDSSKVDFSTLGKKYVLTDYGVKNDPSIVQTEAIQRVIDLAASQGGGVIVVPEGVFKSGALRFRGGTHLYVEGTLKGSDRVVDFPLEPTRIEGQNCMYFPALVNVENVNGFALGGPGVIDGSGYHFWEEMQIRWNWNKETLFSPRATVAFTPAKNENLTYRFSTGVYYQTPFYKEMRDTTTVNNNTTAFLRKDIKSQRSIHFVLGMEYKFRVNERPFKFTAEAYYKALSNLIPYNIDNVRVVYYGGNISKGYAAGLDMKIYGEFVPGTDSWLSVGIMKTEEKIDGGKSVPRPTDQRLNCALFFSDYFPNTDRWKMTIQGHYAGGLPFGPPHSGREKQVFRMSSYRRVDLGISYRLLKNEDRHIYTGVGRAFRNIWLGVDVFNILDISNVNSYYWVTDITNHQYAVPNYLTRRQINARLLFEF